MGITGGELLRTEAWVPTTETKGVSATPEFVAYLELAKVPAGELSPRSKLLMTYALCGFANFGSLGILIGGVGTMIPERRTEVISLGMKSIVAGTIATCMTAAIAGFFV